MWISCNPDSKWNTQIKYKTDDTYFYIEAISYHADIDRNALLYACFKNGNIQTEFEIGTFSPDDNGFSVIKKYSHQYLNSQGISHENLHCFSVRCQNGQVINTYTSRDIDPSVKRAKELLTSIKGDTDYSVEAAKTIEHINRTLRDYPESPLPFLTNYRWYFVDNPTETFGASSVKHILKSDGLGGVFSPWYFGKSTDNRLYSLAVKCQVNAGNPLTNANDCVTFFLDEKSNCSYYIVGIMFLDDGQYFCKLN